VRLGGEGIIKLGLESEHGFIFLFDPGSDVYTNIRRDVTVLDHVVHLFGAPCLEQLALVFHFDFGQAGEETTFGYELGCSAMIRVAVADRIGDDDLGSVLADRADDGHLIRFAEVKEAISESEVFTYSQSHDGGCSCRFFCSQCRVSTSAEFAGSQVNYSDGVACSYVFEDGAGAAEFDIIGVGGYEE